MVHNPWPGRLLKSWGLRVEVSEENFILVYMPGPGAKGFCGLVRQLVFYTLMSQPFGKGERWTPRRLKHFISVVEMRRRGDWVFREAGARRYRQLKAISGSN
jgi:hypothetical protein